MLDIAADPGIIRGPAREALQRLAQGGLMNVEPHRGAFVRGLDLAEVRELFQVLIALEWEAAQLASVRIFTDGLVELVLLREVTTSEVSRGPELAVFDGFDRHALVVHQAGSDRLSQAVTQVSVELRLAPSRSAATGERSKGAVDEYRELVTCLTKRDGAVTRVLMKRDLTAQLQNPLHFMQKAPNDPTQGARDV